MTDLILFYIPCPNPEAARTVARLLLERRLVACANLIPIQSLYWWEGAIAEESECVLIAKTLPAKADAVRAAVKEHHPYQVPCILELPAGANPPFANWVAGEVQDHGRG